VSPSPSKERGRIKKRGEAPLKLPLKNELGSPNGSIQRTFQAIFEMPVRKPEFETKKVRPFVQSRTKTFELT